MPFPYADRSLIVVDPKDLTTLAPSIGSVANSPITFRAELRSTRSPAVRNTASLNAVATCPTTPVLLRDSTACSDVVDREEGWVVAASRNTECSAVIVTVAEARAGSPNLAMLLALIVLISIQDIQRLITGS